MEKYYFTFGSWEKFPYQNTYLVVVASSYGDAVKSFRERHPDINQGCMNCSDCYSEKQWEKVCQYYKDQEPAEIIWTDKCFGEKKEGYSDLYIFVPDVKQIICISEGNGDNLSEEDIESGYVDYIYYTVYQLDNGIQEVGGAEMLLKEMVREKYHCLADCIPDVLEMEYGNRLTDCTILLA